MSGGVIAGRLRQLPGAADDAQRGADRHGDAASMEPPEFTLHFCSGCGEEYERERRAKLFPPSGEQPFYEQLRVIQSSSEHTVVRLVRTESQPSPEEWRFLTSRLPEKYCSVGTEFGVMLTSSQLEYLKGYRAFM